MEKVSVLVVEDEILIAESICKNLRELGYEVFEPVLNYTEALESLKTTTPDIAILDIQLSGNKTGIDLAEKINEDYNIPFIFLTSNSDVETVESAKKVSPQSYLIKPFTKEELYTSIELALYNFANKYGSANTENLLVNDALFVKSEGAYNKVLFDDILYIQSAHVYVEIILKDDKKLVVRSSLNDIIEKLGQKFIRVHRGYIINSDHLSSLKNDVITINDIEIPIGKSYKDRLLERILLT